MRGGNAPQKGEEMPNYWNAKVKRHIFENGKLEVYYGSTGYQTILNGNVPIPICEEIDTSGDEREITFNGYDYDKDDAKLGIEDAFYRGYRFLVDELFVLGYDYGGSTEVSAWGNYYDLESPTVHWLPDDVNTVPNTTRIGEVIKFTPDTTKPNEFFIGITYTQSSYRWLKWQVYINNNLVFENAGYIIPVSPVDIQVGSAEGIFHAYDDPYIITIPYPCKVIHNGVETKEFVGVNFLKGYSSYLISRVTPTSDEVISTLGAWWNVEATPINDDSLDDFIDIVDPPGPTPPTPTDPDTFTFYNFSKKVNSTKQPISGTEITGYFRDAYNLLNPTIIIEAENEFPYNYVSWYDDANDLRRYYWIQNKAWMRNKLIEITLEEDMLATFKTSIGNMNAFVVRSASNFNPLITDTAWTTKNGIDLANATPVNQPFDVANGFYVVGIMEQSQGSANHNFARKGGVDYFACKDDELNELIEFLADKGATGEWADYRPIDRVVYLRFYPFNPGTPTSGTFQNALFQHEYNDGGTMREVEFTWDLHGYAGIVGTLVSGSGYVDFGNHPDAGTDKTYLNYMPYTEMELKAGPFGRIDLSKNLIDKDNVANRLDFTVTADLISGLAKLHIYSGQNLIYYTEDHSCTVDIAISAEFVNRYSDIQQRDFNKKQAVLQTASQAASGAGALIGAATFQNPLLLASGVALMANAIATQERGKDQYIIDSYNMSIPQLSCRGTNGTWMKISENWRLITTYHRIAGDGGAILGRPKNDTVQISSCSGYLICNAASFEDSNAILTEIISINEYLNKGFYYE